MVQYCYIYMCVHIHVCTKTILYLEPDGTVLTHIHVCTVFCSLLENLMVQYYHYQYCTISTYTMYMLYKYVPCKMHYCIFREPDGTVLIHIHVCTVFCNLLENLMVQYYHYQYCTISTYTMYMLYKYVPCKMHYCIFREPDGTVLPLSVLYHQYIHNVHVYKYVPCKMHYCIFREPDGTVLIHIHVCTVFCNLLENLMVQYFHYPRIMWTQD